MKIVTAIPFLLLLGYSSFSQCNNFWHIEQGSVWEYEMFDKKGKSNGKNHQSVTSFESTASGFKAVVHSVMTSDKGKELATGDLEYTCDNGTIYLDMRKFIPEQQYKALENYEVQVEADKLEIPSTLSVGQILKDGEVTVTATNSPVPMKMTVNVVDRKVVAKESVQTPAGKFDCLKITSKSIVKNHMGIAMTFEFSATEWIAPKVGLVKSESYDKKGKLNGSSVLSMVR
jgi:hypothetical protein